MTNPQLITDVYSHYVDSGIREFSDIIDFAKRFPDDYLNRIERSKLFVSPGAEPGESLRSAIDNYKNEMQIWRSKEWCAKHFSGGDIGIVTMGVCERITPNYHLIENSDELRSHPFLCIEAQAHYYELVANMKNTNASIKASFDPSTTAILKALNSYRLDFLANIEDSQIVELRKTNENIAFRRELRDLINSLPTTNLDDLGYVASEVCSHIELVISNYQKQVNNFNDKYNAKHKYSALIGTGTLCVTMLPVLAPFLSTLLPLGLASTVGKYASDKLSQRAESKQYTQSMMGVMSLAKSDWDKRYRDRTPHR